MRSLDTTWIGYNPDALSELHQVGTYATSITYHPNVAVASFSVQLHRHVIAVVTGNEVQYDNTDGFGSPVALTDAATSDPQ